MVSGPGHEALAHLFLAMGKRPVCCVRPSSQQLLIVLLQQLLDWSSSRSLECVCPTSSGRFGSSQGHSHPQALRVPFRL